MSYYMYVASYTPLFQQFSSHTLHSDDINSC